MRVQYSTRRRVECTPRQGFWLPKSLVVAQTSVYFSAMSRPLKEAEGCSHYQNKCELFAPCCKMYYRCHHCHNEARESTCGLLVRSEVPRVRCVECATDQDAPVGPSCLNCATSFSAYFCGECRLYRQADASGIYHCSGCGICRVGSGTGEGGSHWHCDRCVACLPNSIHRDFHAEVIMACHYTGDK